MHRLGMWFGVWKALMMGGHLGHQDGAAATTLQAGPVLATPEGTAQVCDGPAVSSGMRATSV